MSYNDHIGGEKQTRIVTLIVRHVDLVWDFEYSIIIHGNIYSFTLTIIMLYYLKTQLTQKRPSCTLTVKWTDQQSFSIYSGMFNITQMYQL